MRPPGSHSGPTRPRGRRSPYDPRHAGRSSRVPWLIAALGTVIAAAIAAGVVRSAGDSACAARQSSPSPSGESAENWEKGQAVVYSSGASTGRCSYGSPPGDGLYAAVPSGKYAGSAACGSYFDVAGPYGSVRVKVIDHCPGCGRNQLDLSKRAFAGIARKTSGIVAVKYRGVQNPQPPQRLGIQVKPGSSVFWLGVLITGHGNPLSSMEARRAARGSLKPGSWYRLERATDNFWVSRAGLGPRFDLRVRDVQGHRVQLTGLRLTPGHTQRSRTRMYAALPASPSPAAPAGVASLPASPRQGRCPG